MMEDFVNGDNTETKERDEIFSKSVRAGKRTYFFDVKATKGNDLYLTITESKKRFNKDGRYFFEKHKIFLYKEDFEKFEDGLKETFEKISSLRNNESSVYYNTDEPDSQNEFNNSDEEYKSDINFEDI